MLPGSLERADWSDGIEPVQSFSTARPKPLTQLPSAVGGFGQAVNEWADLVTLFFVGECVFVIRVI
jgi:hypothetical protein